MSDFAATLAVAVALAGKATAVAEAIADVRSRAVVYDEVSDKERRLTGGCSMELRAVISASF